MSQDYATLTVGELVAEKPLRSRIFQQIGIDFCCGGKRTLNEVCREKGLDAATVSRMLSAFDSVSETTDTNDWRNASLTELCDNIESTHHAYLRAELPALEQLVNKVATVHGKGEPALPRVEGIFRRFKAEMESHMDKEDTVLFPHIRKLEHSTRLPDFHCASIAQPIQVMEAEHVQAGNDLAEMRRLLNDFEVPQGACNSYRAMLQRLEALERDMHMHVHKENNILFPRASALEEKKRAQ